MTKTEIINKIAKNKTTENLTKNQVSQVVDNLISEGSVLVNQNLVITLTREGVILITPDGADFLPF